MSDYPAGLAPRYQCGILGPWWTGCTWAEFAGAIAVAGTGANPGQTVAYYIPFEVQSTVTVYQGFTRNGATVNGNLDIAIYDETLARLVSSGSTAMAGASSLQVINLTDTTIPKGTYYAGFATDSATATFNQINVVFTGSILQGCGIQVANAVYPLPNPATFPGGSASSTVVPVFGFCYTSPTI